jgi:hypothetical protein
MGADESATIPEIVAGLGVTEQTVEYYVNDNPIAEEVQQAPDELAAKPREEVAYDLLERLVSLRAIEVQLMATTTTQVTGYGFEAVRATVRDVKEHGLTVDEPDEITVETVVSTPAKSRKCPSSASSKRSGKNSGNPDSNSPRSWGKRTRGAGPHHRDHRAQGPGWRRRRPGQRLSRSGGGGSRGRGLRLIGQWTTERLGTKRTGRSRAERAKG